jgi:hypothetical protein
MACSRILEWKFQAMFDEYDRVRIKDGGLEVWTITKIMNIAPKKYWIELNGEAATGQWKAESELELVEKAKNPDTGSGFTPSQPIM